MPQSRQLFQSPPGSASPQTSRQKLLHCHTSRKLQNICKKHQSEASQSLITVINDLLSFSGMFAMKFSGVAMNCGGDALYKSPPTYGGLAIFSKTIVHKLSDSEYNVYSRTEDKTRICNNVGNYNKKLLFVCEIAVTVTCHCSLHVSIFVSW